MGGICGGYQLLGRTIRDPQQLESPHNSMDGLGLLPIETVFAAPKIVEQTAGRHAASGCAVAGYQVRMGRTVVPLECQPFLELVDAQGAEHRPEGMSLHGGRLFGTYLHGLFDHALFRRWWINGLRASNGWNDLHDTETFSLDARLDRLADFVERHLDMSLISRLLEEGV